ncbi:MAG TPA: aminotransferase class V-fold PLP-dependent enzyme, partial [Candidatus Agathobaculum stercoravium]|nr:aminotransferase class V-fold PLP-dependent enzyme [Candidatus Agathobaculum stercoravium]
PQGIGALLLRPDFAKTLEPLVSGGTGSVSDSEDIPLYLPDRFEPGTPNLPGIYGWEAALAYLESVTVEAAAAHDRALSERFLIGLRDMPGVALIGPDTAEGRVGVFSLDFPGKDNAEITARLEEDFGILTRCGLHCAPSAHRTLGTFPRGTVRLSLGWFSTEEDIDRALQAVKAVSAG